MFSSRDKRFLTDFAFYIFSGFCWFFCARDTSQTVYLAQSLIHRTKMVWSLALQSSPVCFFKCLLCGHAGTISRCKLTCIGSLQCLQRKGLAYKLKYNFFFCIRCIKTPLAVGMVAFENGAVSYL